MTNKNVLIPLSLLLPLLLMCFSPLHAQEQHSENMTLKILLEQVLDYYPSLETAALQVEKARQTSALIESRLGWQVAGQGGISKDMSLFGSPVTSLNIGGQMTRQLTDGDSMAVVAMISRDDADQTLPTLPNPALNSSIELQYRKPLRQGKENTGYQADIKDAQALVKRLTAAQQLIFDQLAEQMIELYAGTLATQQRIETIKATIAHTQRLHEFIIGRVNFGIAEDKDRLQTDAQLNSLKAQLEVLELIKTRQTININRLLGKSWQSPLTLVRNERIPTSDNLKFVIKDVNTHSPALQINAAEIALAEIQIERQQDINQDKFDLVFSVGHRGLNGDNSSGSIHNNELVGGVQVEYGRALDLSANDTALYQARLERDIALQNKKEITRDLEYKVATVIAELRGIAGAIKAYRISVASEHDKLDEAVKRYRTGRITIDQVIQFENQTATSELELALQQIEYQRTLDRLDLLRGVLLNTVKLPAQNHTHEH